MTQKRVPEFAIVGHPNEGKSSVVSTLAEDDSVRISPTPGETVECRTFPVVIDGREIIRFIDTPGFQNPKKSLQWMREYTGDDDFIIQMFRENHLGNPNFRDDCELFMPIARGAGVIYVVDGSRPLRNVDRAEMEILRLTGRPRMAIINCKAGETRYLDQWKSEFRKHFNAIRVFNAHKAAYAERINLLENLKSIDQDWQAALETVIAAFKKDWDYRNTLTADIICSMLTDCLTCSLTKNFTENTDESSLKERLREEFNRAIQQIESKAHQQIRRLYKHNIFKMDLPPYSILHEALFNEKTWQFLGLTPKQLITAAGVSGAAVGAVVDVIAHGLTFGIFSALGGAVGAGWAALGGGKKLAKTKMVGMNLGGHQLQAGPPDNIQLLYILLDRALIFYSHIINWAHGRRDYPRPSGSKEIAKAGVTTEWDDKTRQVCHDFFKAVRSSDEAKKSKAQNAFKKAVKEALQHISLSERRYGLVQK